jgi:hypothetical protein
VVEDGIGVRLVKSGDAFIFSQKRSEHLLPAITVSTSVEKGRNTPKFIVVQHWYLSLASPTPEHFHRPITVAILIARILVREIPVV